MNKPLKVLLKIFLIIAGIVLLFITWYYWSSWNMKRQAKADSISESELCDAVQLITEQPSINCANLEIAITKELRFYLVRNNKVIKDTLIRTGFNAKTSQYALRVPIPFGQFLKTDTIVVKTKNKLYYHITGFHHYAYLHYGMFGYLGSSDCRFSESCMVNGKKQGSATLIKSEGLKKTPVAIN